VTDCPDSLQGGGYGASSYGASGGYGGGQAYGGGAGGGGQSYGGGGGGYVSVVVVFENPRCVCARFSPFSHRTTSVAFVIQ